MPGDPDRVKQLARELHDFADDVADALRQIKGMAGEDALLRWAGKTAKAFQDEFEEVPKNLKKLQRSYDLAGDALAAYWPTLERAQSLADKALARGREARNELSSATGRLESANSWVDQATKKTEEYDEKEGKEKPDDSEVRAATRNATDAKSAQTSAQTAVDNAESGLEAAKKMAADAKKMREDAAAEAKDKLEDASDAGIQNRKWWEKAVDWVKDNWDTIVSVCKVIVAVLGIVVLIIGGPLAWVVLAAALVVLADTLVKYMNGEASLWDVAFAALDCIPGMKGLTTLGGLAKIAKGGMTAMKGGLKGMALAVKGLGARGFNRLRSGASNLRRSAVEFVQRLKCRDPVDPVTGEMIMQEVDVSLPAVLPLEVQRTHISSYRQGRWFGPSWASTFDQRLELDGEGVCYAAPDGSILVYPVPVPGAEVYPLEGRRLPLTWDENPHGEMTLADPVEGVTMHFAAIAGGPPQPEGVTLVLRALSSRNGQRLDFEYGSDGRPTAIRHSGGYRIDVETEGGRITALRLHTTGEALVRYRYDDGDLSEVVNSSGKPLRLSYDPHGRIVGWQDRVGTEYRYDFDEADRVVAVSGSEGFLTGRFVYDADSQVTEVVDSLGSITAYYYNDAFQVVREVDPLGHVVRREYDRHHRLLSRTDPLGRTESYAYDAVGKMTGVTRPDGSTATLEYGQLGLPTAYTDFNGFRWEREYDDRGNCVTMTDPVGATTAYVHDECGRLTAVTDALGGVTRVVPDGAGLPLETTDPAGAVTSYRRNALGQVVTITDGAGTVHYTWTLEGRPTVRTLADGATERWDWDGEGNLVGHVDAAGNTTELTHTHFALLAAQQDPDGARLEFSYDTELRLRTVTNRLGLVWTYEYDGAGRLISETDFDGRRLTCAYDAAGQLISRTNGAGEVLRFGHDVLGHVTEVRVGDSVVEYGHDAGGRLVRAAADGVELSMERDHHGQVAAETCNGRTLTNVYDELGRRTERRTPGGALSTWTYDAGHRPVSLQTAGQAVEFGFDTAGREVLRRFGDNAVLEQRWDTASRLLSQVVSATGPAPRPLQERRYTYDAAGATTSVTDAHTGTRRFGLDPVGRVTTADTSSRSERYAYDTAGNISLAEITGSGGGAADPVSTGPRTHAGSRLTRAGRSFYEYDAQGRVVRHTRKLLSGGRRVWTYMWDAGDRLTDVVTPDGSHWHYRYDPLSRRIGKQKLAADGSVEQETFFVWDGARLAEQWTQSRGTVTTWDWAPGSHQAVGQSERPLPGTAHQEETDARFYAIVTDAVGMPAELVTEDGDVAWRSGTTLWGLPAGPGGREVDCPLSFPGQYRDDESGLHYNLHRYYSPETGRYQSPDPLGLRAGPNPYAYVPNPSGWIDPLGLICQNANQEHGHIADVQIRGTDGSIRTEFGIWSGRTTPEETAATQAGWNRRAVTHTEHRVSRMAGASTGPRISIPNDPYFNTLPVQPGETVVFDAVLPPCRRCQGAMNRMIDELGVDVVYSWDGPEGAGVWANGTIYTT